MAAQADKKRGQSFIQGALVLTISMAIVKLIGMLFKMVIGNVLDITGFACFNAAYELYNPLYTLATAGLPIAISRMVSENMARQRFRDVRQIHRISVPIFTITGVVGFLFMIGGAFVIPAMMNTPGAVYPTLALAPMIFFACLMASYRGYYEGLRNMVPTAVSEIIEALCKLAIGLSASYAVTAYGSWEYQNSQTIFGMQFASEADAQYTLSALGAAGAIAGITLGSVFGFVYIFHYYKKYGDGITRRELMDSPRTRSSRVLLKILIRTAVPIAMSSLVVNISSLVDTLLVQNRLYDIMVSDPGFLPSFYPGLFLESDIAANRNMNTTLYGCFGLASTVVMLIPAVTQMFGISALPSVTAAWTEGNRKKIKHSIESVIRITTLITIPSGMGMAVLAHPIISLLFGGKSEQEINVAADVLVILGIAAIFTATSTPLCSMLQAVGRVDLPVKLLTVGVIMKVVFNYVLVGIPQINIQGAGMGSLVCYVFITAMALYCLCKQTRIRPNFVSIFIKPLLSGVFCALAAYLSHLLFIRFMPGKVATLCAIAMAVLVYFISLLALKAVTKGDILRLPKGQKIAKILEKHKWIE